MRIRVIAAMARDRGIGINNQLPWKCQEDMRHFAQTTKSGTRNAVVMGRNTWMSLGCKPLRDRLNVVLTTKDCSWDTAITARSFKHAIEVCESESITDMWIIGGEQLYSDVLTNHKDSVDECIITTMPVANGLCDRFFPRLDDSDWALEAVATIGFYDGHPVVVTTRRLRERVVPRPGGLDLSK